ncbi:MAG: holo-ACP synthase [Proteobacteria bacterium]|nr:holo-ACP synthase [Pseudomonadota bacterium]
MALLGTGVDLVDVERLRVILANGRRGERFKQRVFTPGERSYSDGCSCPEQAYAARFAAKEALLKALGSCGGPAWGFPWQDIDVVHSPAGAPCLQLSGRVAQVARDLGVGSVHLSLAHERAMAVATVVLEAAPG